MASTPTGARAQLVGCDFIDLLFRFVWHLCMATRRGALLAQRRCLYEPSWFVSTQGCSAAGWPEDYVSEKGEIAREALAARGVGWNSNTAATLAEIDGPLDASAASDAIRHAAIAYEPSVRQATGSHAPYDLTVESADVDAYWAYWLDGAGHRVRLRLNMRNANFTEVRARQMALHEILGHGLQSASIAARCAAEDVPWVRLLSVHGPQQVLLEGWAQAMPLFITPDDEPLVASIRLVHYTHLVRSELHLALNAGTPIERCCAPNIEAGEHIRYLPKHLAATLVPADDFWLFGSSTVAFNTLDEGGAGEGLAVTTDQRIAEVCTMAAHELWQQGIDYAEYMQSDFVAR
ncbi:hypothetical protein NLM24_33010 [Nocardia zapadnayensis]|uniref:DUF6879 family protein n=1 Tax=Nocardia rhamnosiphila TaxID=426716 RepID=UPI0022485531|nr:DUF6879 family protein [Nocardia zapadnayensis]MCX0275413.1 hypothetical protein [Nocardia zapadnayensis]